MDDKSRNALFEEQSAGKIILKTSIPAILTILVMLIYNMADVFFVGKTGDELQLAAISLASPLVLILSGVGH